jgi:hypothetical protein
MVSCHSSSFSVFVDHCPCITQVSNRTYSFVFLFSHESNTTSCSDIFSVYFFFYKFFINSLTNSFDDFGDVSDLVFVFIKLFFKNLNLIKKELVVLPLHKTQRLWHLHDRQVWQRDQFFRQGSCLKR